MIKPEDIFTDGKLPEAKVIDFNSPEIQEKLAKVQEEIEKVMANSKIDYSKLNVIIDI